MTPDNAKMSLAPTDSTSPLQRLACARCGTSFECGASAGACWCMGETYRLPMPAAAAARLGFPKGDIPGVDVRCLKTLHTFHFRDPNTALINIDRVIYTFKRQ